MTNIARIKGLKMIANEIIKPRIIKIPTAKLERQIVPILIIVGFLSSTATYSLHDIQCGVHLQAAASITKSC